MMIGLGVIDFWKHSWKAALGAILIGVLEVPLVAEEESSEVSEVFRVSNVGRSNVAETRELLMAVYGVVEKDYNAEVVKKREALEKAYRGDQVRVIKKLGESDANGPLYLCAYKGSPSVVSIAGEPRKVGELTPPLAIEEDGTHETEITRTIKEKVASESGQPALEEADSGGAVSFFGIPLVFDDGPSMKRSTGTGGGSSEPKKRPKTKEVTEKKTLKKFTAKVSTEQLVDGPPMLSTQIFLDLVKNGEVFKVKREESRRCQRCRGFGRVTDTMNRREPDGKMNCPDCSAAGKRDWDVTYVITW